MHLINESLYNTQFIKKLFDNTLNIKYFGDYIININTYGSRVYIDNLTLSELSLKNLIYSKILLTLYNLKNAYYELLNISSTEKLKRHINSSTTIYTELNYVFKLLKNNDNKIKNDGKFYKDYKSIIKYYTRFISLLNTLVNGTFEPVYKKDSILYKLQRIHDINITNITNKLDNRYKIDINNMFFQNKAYIAVKNGKLIECLYLMKDNKLKDIFKLNFNIIKSHLTISDKNVKNIINNIKNDVLLPLLTTGVVLRINDVDIPIIDKELLSAFNGYFNNLIHYYFKYTYIDTIDSHFYNVISNWKAKKYDIFEINDLNISTHNSIIPYMRNLLAKTDDYLNSYKNKTIPQYVVNNYEFIKLLHYITVMNTKNIKDSDIQSTVKNYISNINDTLSTFEIGNNIINPGSDKFNFNKLIYNNIYNSYIHTILYPFLLKLYEYIKKKDIEHILNLEKQMDQLILTIKNIYHKFKA